MQQQSSDNNIDNAFREKLGGLRTEPRSRVWYRVSAGLDREAALVAHKRRRVIGVLIGVIILIGIILTAVLDPVATRRKVSNTNGEMPENKIEMKHNSGSAPTVTVNSTVPSASQIIVAPSVISLKENSIYSAVTVETNDVESVTPQIVFNTETANSIDHLPLFVSFVNETNENVDASKFKNALLVLNETVTTEINNEPIPCACKNKFYIGANIGFNRASFADTALAKNLDFVDKIHIQKSFSVFGGYRINKNFSAELGWNIFSNEGQWYGYTTHARDNASSIKRKDYVVSLRYTQIPVKVRYEVETWSGIFKTHVTYSIAAGAMYGKLTKADFSIADYNLSTTIKKSELAAVGNLAVDINLNRNFSFSTGASASYSNNILQQGKYLHPFTSPHNFLLGVTAGLKYSFCRK